MNIHHSNLFNPSRIGALKIPNALAVAPMTRVSAQEDGLAGPLMKHYYEDFARGGFGLIITEGLYTDIEYSQGYFKQPGLATEEQAESWRPIIEGVHRQNGVIIAQLMHAGALSQYNRFADKSAGPSSVRPKGEQMSFYYGKGSYRVPKAMSDKDIETVIDGFVSSAKRAQSAGFDGVEIHSANGYLLDQFLTTYTNLREDRYGGDLANRLCLHQEIIETVRAAVGESFVVGIRFSQKKVNDTEYLWGDGEKAAKQVFRLMKECGVDYIHTTEPLLSDPAFSGSASLAALAKKYSDLPVIANGGVEEPQLASEMLESGHADFIALGKIALSNPDWPNVIKASGVINAFDFSMLSPIADLECATRYRNGG